MLQKTKLDSYLTNCRYLELIFNLNNTTIKLIPHKAWFMITVYRYHIIEYQGRYDDWNEAFKQYQHQCNKYIDVECKENNK